MAEYLCECISILLSRASNVLSAVESSNSVVSLSTGDSPNPVLSHGLQMPNRTDNMSNASLLAILYTVLFISLIMAMRRNVGGDSRRGRLNLREDSLQKPSRGGPSDQQGGGGGRGAGGPDMGGMM